MTKKILYLATIATIVLFGACNNEDNLPKATPTISLTASVAEDGANTRVSLTQEADTRTIQVRWQVNDEIELAYVQDATKEKKTATVTSISNEGRTAHFDIPLPTTLTGEFTLYGVYGGGGIDVAGANPVIKLPTGAGSATSLNGAAESVQSRKDAVIYFEKKMNTTDTQVNVVFNHLGSFFSVTLANNSANALENIEEARLVGIDNTGNENWVYNLAEGGQTFDLLTEAFQNTTSGGNYISFKASKTTLEKQKSITYWAWYPSTDKVWPALQLKLTDGTTIYQTSANSTSARTVATPAGRSIYINAGWDGTELHITHEYSGTFEELRALTEEQRKTIRKLTLTGAIYKADYEVMKNMPNLTYVDLSAATSYGSINGSGVEVINTIPHKAFGGGSKATANQNITSIILPRSVTEIGDFAFSECRGLTGELNLPTGLKTIGASAFKECQNLTGSLTIPDGVTTIENHAFYNCMGFDGTLMLSTDLVKVGHNAFRNLLNITGTLTIPASVTKIEFNGFHQCWKLTRLVFEDRISPNTISLDKKAFESCIRIEGIVTLPKGLSAMEEAVFCKCTKVTALRFTNESVFPYTDNMICKNTENPAPFSVQVPTALLTQYQDADGWKDLPAGTITRY